MLCPQPLPSNKLVVTSELENKTKGLLHLHLISDPMDLCLCVSFSDHEGRALGGSQDASRTGGQTHSSCKLAVIGRLPPRNGECIKASA